MIVSRKNMKKILMSFMLIAMSASGAIAAEQYIPLLVARTGAMAEQARPIADGTVDFLNIVNERGGVNGVKLIIDECEFGYDTTRGVECYERLKNKHGGAIAMEPWSTGVSYTLMEKAPVDKIPLIMTTGYGSSATADGEVFEWLFPIGGNYWIATDTTIQAIGEQEGGIENLRDKKIAYIYLDVAYGKEPIPLLKEWEKELDFDLSLLPVTAPGLNQQAIWTRIRRENPDYIILWTFGVSTPIALEEARKIGFPRDKMYGSYWAGAEPDVAKEGEKAKGYNAAVYQSTANYESPIAKEALAVLYDNGRGAGGSEYRDAVGSVLWIRGAISGLYMVEAIRTAQEKYGEGKPITAEQMRWGLENLDITEEKTVAMGFENLIAPMKLSCKDHMGTYKSRMSRWTGEKWVISTDWIEANRKIMDPMIKKSADDYAERHNITRRSCS